MNRFWKVGTTASILIGCLSCAVDHDAASVELQFVSQPSSSCQYSVGAEISFGGFFDVLQPNEGYYQLVFQARNNMALGSTDALTFGPLANARDQGTGANIVGFEGCWYLYEGNVTKLGDITNGGNIVDCASIPAQSGSFPAISQTDAGLVEQLVGLNILGGDMLKSLYGDDFDIVSLSQDPNNFTGFIYSAAQQQMLYSPILKAPGSDSNRPVGWGKNYPATLQSTIIMQLRGIYTTQGGSQGKTNWVAYPITFCPSCLSDICGETSYTACPNVPCTAGGACPASGVCSDGTQCGLVASKDYIQQTYPNWGTGQTCLPAQGDSSTITCTLNTSVTAPTCPASVP